MVYRYSWLAGSAALLFVLYQLNGLLRPTTDGPPWQLVVVAALVLGIAITWTALAYRLPTWLTVLANGLAAMIAVVRVSAPDTALGFIPTAETVTTLSTQLELALRTIRQGIEPVIPIAGLVVVLLVLFWAVGFLFAWGLSKGHPYVALLPPLVIALQFATMDRQGTSPVKAAVFLAVVAASLLAITMDQREHTSGRMVAIGEYRTRPAKLSRSASGLLAGVVAAAALSMMVVQGAVPADGVIDWRSPTGLTGGFYGSVSYNPFVGIKQQLVANSDTPVFVFNVIDSEIPGDEIYFSLLTLDTYNGGQFYAARPEVVSLEEEDWLNRGHAFVGPTDTVVADVEIQRLTMEWLPAPHAPVAFDAARNVKNAILARNDDASLRYEGGITFPGMRYQITSEVPAPDVAALAATVDGVLSPAFQLAADAAENVPDPIAVETREEPPNVDRYLELPDDLDEGVAALAAQRTRNLVTPFERGIALESWFRDPTQFRYSTDIVPGHGATDLADWLLDEDSPNHRIGYCENFATAMAVMARTLDIPSRVVLGFTPGIERTDGFIQVLDRNAHAWVELWMPTQGWVQFDPTPRSDGVNPTTFREIETSLGFPLTDYLDVPDPEIPEIGGRPPLFGDFTDEPPGFAPVGGSETTAPGLALPGWVTSVLPWLSGFALLFFGVPVVKWWRRRRRIRRLRHGDISAAWSEIVGRLDDFGMGPDPADTPLELAAKVDPTMRPLATVYSRSLYGGVATLPEELVDIATTSLADTEKTLVTRHTRLDRMRARYRIGSILPRRWRRGASRS